MRLVRPTAVPAISWRNTPFHKSDEAKGVEMIRILILEPNPVLANRWKQSLEKKQYWVMTCGEPSEARDWLKKQFFRLCVWPVNDVAGIKTIFDLKQSCPESAILSTSDSSEPSFVVQCMRAGASNFFVKLESADVFAELVTETISRFVPIPSQYLSDLPFPYFIGRHPKIREIFELIQRIKDTDSNILITGESGTGKELVARAIHALSPRRKQPWVAVNCGAIPANLLESELFGHVKGAFTGATNNRMGRFQLSGSGTLFLDEISDLSLDLQAKILRAIQNRVYEPVGSAHSLTLEARVIAATHQDLETAVNEKRFREDLYYRLNVIPIYIPPLRSRKSDIPLLVRNFLESFSQANGKGVAAISEDAMQCLMQYHWPGNVRELENFIERVVVLRDEGTIVEPKDFPVGYFKTIRPDRFVANVALPDDGIDFNQAVSEFENELILQALHRTSGNKNRAASLLKLNRTTLVEKLKRKNLQISS